MPNRRLNVFSVQPGVFLYQKTRRALIHSRRMNAVAE